MAVVAPDVESAIDPAALARTYDNPVYDDAWASVRDYDAAMAYTEEYDSPSSTAVARELDVPRGRVRAWYDGSKPDAVRGLEVARQHGWLPVTTDEDVFRGLNALAAWDLAGGSIAAETYVPAWTVRPGEDERIVRRAAELANCRLDVTRSAEAGRTAELRPVNDASVLGRVLSVLGVPRGKKHADRSLALPDYLEDAPTRLRREFVQVYLRNRGQDRPDADGLRFREARSSGYLRELAALIEAETGEPVRVSGRNVTLSAAAARALAAWEPVLGLERAEPEQ